MNDNNNQDEFQQLSAWFFTLGIVSIFVFLVVGILLWDINIVPIRDSFSSLCLRLGYKEAELFLKKQ